mgnify:CR=1 FL=1
MLCVGIPNASPNASPAIAPIARSFICIPFSRIVTAAFLTTQPDRTPNNITIPPQSFQSLEESGHLQASQRPKSSTHWRKTDAHKPPSREKSPSHWKNHPATDHPSDPNPPPTGRIWTLTGLTAGRLFQWMEEYGLSRAPSGKIVPVDGRIETWTVLSRTWVEFTRIAATKKAYRALRALSVSLIGG